MIVSLLIIIAVVLLINYMDRPGFSPMTYSVWRAVQMVMAGLSIFYGLKYLVFMDRPLHLLLSVWFMFCAWSWLWSADKAAKHREVARQHAQWKAMWR